MRTLRPVAERRRAQRVPMGSSGPVSVVGARLLAVSCYGMGIESPVLLESGSVLRFRFVVAGEQADVDAKVMHCEGAWRGPRRVFEVGLEFQALPVAVRDRLADTLRSLRAATA